MGRSKSDHSSGATSSSSRMVKGSKTALSSSKFVGSQLSKLSKQEVERSKKNPKTKEKWLTKMTISVQKSVSLASSMLFADADDGEESSDAVTIQQDIERLKSSIQPLLDEIQGKKQIAGRKYECIKDDIASTDARTGKRSNQYEGCVSRIAEKFNQVANQVDTVGSDLKSRLKAFETSYNTIEREVRNFSSSKRGPTGLHEGQSTTQGSASLHQLSQHLGKR